MFKLWKTFGTRNSLQAEYPPPPPIPTDCSKEQVIAKLQSELSATKANFDKLQAEVEQGYIKDSMRKSYGYPSRHGTYTWLEYIEKLGETSVKYYDGKLSASGFILEYERKLLHTWDTETCIALRDFLLKNFPVKEEPNG